ncbi:MAG: hypothetical protein ACRDK9_04615 [Solirubrobacterales bacterium]
MGIRDRLGRLWSAAGGESHTDGLGELHVGDPRFDDWEVVRDFDELDTARAFRQTLTDQAVDAVLTADWPLDDHGRGDIALRVPPGHWSEADELLEQP